MGRRVGHHQRSGSDVRDRLAESGESTGGSPARGSLLDLNQAALRSGVEERYTGDGTGSAATRLRESEDQGVEEAGRVGTGQRKPQDQRRAFRPGDSSTAVSRDRRLQSAPTRDRFGVEPICSVLSEHENGAPPPTTNPAKRGSAVTCHS